MLSGIYRHLFRSNLHPLDPPHVWRIARGSGSARWFEGVLKSLKIRTAIDLRRPESADGARAEIDFSGLGVTYHNLHLRSSRLPRPEAVARYLELLRTCERPLLLYCKRGKDKTGFGSALYRHVCLGESLEDSWQELRRIPYGHRKRGHEGPHDFKALLDQDSTVNSDPRDLDQWVREIYPAIFEEITGEPAVIDKP